MEYEINIPEKIRTKLQFALSQDVLDFINQKFKESEEYCRRMKAAERQVEQLHRQLREKDQMLMSMYGGWGQSGEGYQSMGYIQPEYRSRPKNEIYNRRPKNETENRRLKPIEDRDQPGPDVGDHLEPYRENPDRIYYDEEKGSPVNKGPQYEQSSPSRD